jgi:hypothetical protein
VSSRCNCTLLPLQDVNFDLYANFKHALPHLSLYLLSGVAAVKCILELLATGGHVSLWWTPATSPANATFALMWTVFLWSMISQPPRMLLYGMLRARRERARAAAARRGSVPDVSLNAAVPAMQELLNTPLTTFPPWTGELWDVYAQAADTELAFNPQFLMQKKAMQVLGVSAAAAAAEPPQARAVEAVPARSGA